MRYSSCADVLCWLSIGDACRSCVVNLCKFKKSNQDNRKNLDCNDYRRKILSIETQPIRQHAEEEAEQWKRVKESSDGRGKIRYISSWCLHILKKRRMKKIWQNVCNPKLKKEGKQLVFEKKVIEHLETDEMHLADTSEQQDSLHEICRKQNVRRDLTNVSDVCFLFFMALDKTVRLYQTEANLNLHGKKLSDFLILKLKNDQKLTDIWTNLFSSFDGSFKGLDNIKKKILHEIISIYSLMSIAQLRKEHLERNKAFRKGAMRQQLSRKKDGVKHSQSTLKRKVNIICKGKSKKAKKAAEWPCGICGKDASDNSVACDKCDIWFHGDCMRIEDLNALPDEWFCPTCTKNQDSE
ncbi:hypothetical protein ACJMK2_038514 [Sinanodonta woodiana]|uniref:PHD-type domain-containing protein n=1 Tax=Sinanodonta woodiana TaxID=1069815 RepID=A0ABD3WAM1_SINWO